jgi:ATP-binding cassette subfamily B protein
MVCEPFLPKAPGLRIRPFLCLEVAVASLPGHSEGFFPMSDHKPKPLSSPRLSPSTVLAQPWHQHKGLWSYLNLFKPYSLALASSMFFCIIKTSPEWVVPILTASVINLVTVGGAQVGRELLLYLALGMGIIFQNIPTHYLFVRLFSTSVRDVEGALRGALCLRLQQLAMTYYSTVKIGAIQTKVLRDVENIEMMTRQVFSNIPTICFKLAAAILVIAYKAPQFLVFYLMVIPCVLLIHKLNKRKMTSVNREFRRNIEDMSGRLIEMIDMLPVTRAHNLEGTEIDRVNTRIERVRDTGLRMDSVNSIYASLNWCVFMFFNLLTLMVSGWVYHKQILPIQIGDIILFTAYFNTISGSVSAVMGFYPMLVKGLESIRSIEDILQAPHVEKYDHKTKLKSVRGGFRFDRVSYRYEGGDRPVLDELCLDVKPGETIAVIGPSGSGKTTLMQLIMGFLLPSEGEIYLDGHKLSEVDFRSVRQHLSVVTQQTLLFDGSIRDNIAYGCEGVSDEDLMRVIHDANLGEFIDSLPDGIHTPIYERGARLSGGQKQRIAIARAMLRNPQVLILDEATSALDLETEKLIQDAVDRVIRNRTAFIVAHRLSTIRNADRIIVLNEGRLQELGSHQELLDRKGYYYEMMQLQN